MTWKSRYGTFMSGALKEWKRDPTVSWFVDAVTYVATVVGIQRGIDLIRSPESQSEINLYVVISVGQDTWGMILIVMCFYAFLVTLDPHRRLLTYMTGPVLAAAAYGAYSVVMIAGFLVQGPPFTGTRFIAPPIAQTLVLTMIFVYQLRDLPRQILPTPKRRATDEGGDV